MKTRLYDPRAKRLHLWNGERFWTAKDAFEGRPVALCNFILYPRDPERFIDPEKLVKYPICRSCLRLEKD